MKFSEAMAAMEQGKKVRLDTWYKDDYIFLKDGYIYHQGNKIYNIPSNIPMHSSWSIYEPKVNAGDIQEGEIFEFCGMKYRRVPSYMKEYAPVQMPGWDIVVVRQQPDGMYPAGSVTVFTDDCKVKKVS